MRAVYLAIAIGLLLSIAVADAQDMRATVQPGPVVRSGFPASADVFIDGSFAIRIPASAGGMSPTLRAQSIADRLNQAFAAGRSWESMQVNQFEGEWGVGLDGQLIATADANSARAYRTSPGQLASRWANQTVIAMGGNPRMIASQLQPVPSMVAGEQAEIMPTFTTAQTKTVPLLDSENGNELGQVMVAGSTSQLSSVNSVIVYHTTSDGAEVWTFVPITSTSTTSPTRVQGVGVTGIPSNLMPTTGWQMGSGVLPMISQSAARWNSSIGSMLTTNNVPLRGSTKVVPFYCMDGNDTVGAAQIVGSAQGVSQAQTVVRSMSGNMWRLYATSSQSPITGTPAPLTDVVVSSIIMFPSTAATPAPEMEQTPSPGTPSEEPEESMPMPPSP